MHSPLTQVNGHKTTTCFSFLQHSKQEQPAVNVQFIKQHVITNKSKLGSGKLFLALEKEKATF